MLTLDERSHFRRDGYLVLPSVVGEDLLAAAEEEIESFIAAESSTDVLEVHGRVVEGDQAAPGQHQWFPPVSRLPACDRALRASGVLEAAEELTAPASLDHAFDHIQIATTVAPWSHTPGGPHIDGHTEDPPAPFTMLVGILLTDQTERASGNLWVWPGSHLAHAKLFADRGPRALLSTQGHATLLDPPLPLPPPIELTGRRGDVLLAHYLLGHNKGGNTSSNTRRTVYYRLATADHRNHWESALCDPWNDFPSLRQLAASDSNV